MVGEVVAAELGGAGDKGFAAAEGEEPLERRLEGVAAPEQEVVALAVAEAKADAGFAVETVARQHRLDFLPLFRERYDLLLWRRDAFEPPLQKLLAFCRTDAFATRAAELGGYDLTDHGQVRYNGP